MCGCLLALASISLPLAAQTTAPGQWTWVGGSQLPNQIPDFGYQGVTAPTNIPGSLVGASTWTDANGNLWLFGGQGFLILYINATPAFAPLLNDMWEYSPATNQWTFMGGNQSAVIDPLYPNIEGTSPGVYGTLEVPAAANTPGSRSGAMSWTDKAGNFWLFGGSGFDADSIWGPLNDLWEYSPVTNQWTWMGGDTTLPANDDAGWPGVYGTLGTPAPGNTPGSRTDASAWTDTDGNFWLFGGFGWAAVPGESFNTTGPLNDLWEFNSSINQWAWMGGSMPAICSGQQVCNQPGIYGTLGSAAAGNIPSSRYSAQSWTDSSGNLWLFGGQDCPGANDLWEFSPKTLLWAWMGGTVPQMEGNTCNSVPGIYGTLGTAAPENFPGSRYGGTTWTDKNGNLWLFGGDGQDANGYTGNLDDLWQFNPSMNQWTWMGGSSAFACFPYVEPEGANCGLEPAVYGAKETPSEANLPGTLSAPATWLDKNGNVWLFGGDGSAGFSNTLWLYQPSSTPTFTPTATPVVLPVTDTYNLPQSVTITDVTPGSFIYYTTDGITTPTTSSALYNGAFTISATQTVQAVAIAPNYLNSDIAANTYTINIPSSPPQIVSGLSPSTYLAEHLDFAMTVNGLRFTSGSIVYWGSSALSTTYVSATQLIAQVPAADVAAVGITPVTVETPQPGGGTSNAFQFEVDSSASEPTDPALFPFVATISAGSPASYKLTVPPSVTGLLLMSCLNLPAGASCSYSSATNTLTISTSSATPPGTYQITVVCTETVEVASTSSFMLSVLLLPLAIRRRQQAGRTIFFASCLAMTVLAAVFFVGCGSGGGGGGSGGSGGGGSGSGSTQQMTGSDVITLIVQ